MENIFLTPKIKNLSRKKFCPPFCMKTFHCDLLPKLTLSQTKMIYNFPKILTLEAGAGDLAGNKGFYVMIFS
jgi:hypothetical protein